MKCTNCNKNEATVFYRQVINGKETKYALCEKCAKDKENEINMSFDSFYSDFGESLLGSFFAPALGAKKEKKKCSLCAKTFEELCESGFAGCPECYTVFESEFVPTIKRLHGNTVHRGKVPKIFQAKKTKETKIEELEKQLKTAVSEERYEDAAQIRDRLKGLRAE